MRMTRRNVRRLAAAGAIACGAWSAAAENVHASDGAAGPVAGAPDPDRAALVMIEFQNEWLAEDGGLRFLIEDEAEFEAAVDGGREALASAREAGMPVVHVGLRFSEGYPELRPAEHGLRAAIPRAGTWLAESEGAAFHEDFQPAAGELVPRGRNGASGFAGSDLDALLRERGIETLYLAGFALHVCVESTLREAHDLGYAAVVLEDATAAFNEEQRDYVLKHIVHHFGQAISNETFTERVAAFETAKERGTEASVGASDAAGPHGSAARRAPADRAARGMERLRSLDEAGASRVMESLGRSAPRLAGFARDFAFGESYDPSLLSVRERQIATIAALASMGGAEPQLRWHVNAGLNVGLSRAEVIELLTHTAVYAGFPRAINGVMAAEAVFTERDAAAGGAGWETEASPGPAAERGVQAETAAPGGAD